MPQADWARFRAWSRDLVRLLDPLVASDALERALLTRLKLRGYLRGLIAERRPHPAGDLLSALIAAEDQGHQLTEAELVSMCVLLQIAGHETTVNLIANGTLALLGHPEVAARLRADPGLAGSAVEELLRYDSPVQFTSRHATADLDIGGHRVRAGETVIAVLGAANRPCWPACPALSWARGSRSAGTPSPCAAWPACRSPSSPPARARPTAPATVADVRADLADLGRAAAAGHRLRAVGYALAQAADLGLKFAPDDRNPRPPDP